MATKVKSAQAKAENAALVELARLGGEMFREDDIERGGSKLRLPETMTFQQVIDFLYAKIAEGEEHITLGPRVMNYRPWDVGYAVNRAFRKAFGAVTIRGGFFGTAVQEVPSGPNGEFVSVPWGSFAIPFLPNVSFRVGGERSPEFGLVGSMTASGPLNAEIPFGGKVVKLASIVEGVFKLVEEELKTASLYRGKAFTAEEMPQFIDVDAFDENKVVYADHVMAAIEANIFAPLRYPDQHREMGLPLKRAVLLKGAFGTGKSLGISWTGKEAVKNGWTFILVRPGRDDLDEAMRTARIYAPAVVAFEDIDTVADASKDVEAVSKMLDLFDGIQAKKVEVMAVLTTNHPEKLHKGMMRPGRLDAIIEVTSPDANGIRKLIEVNTPAGRLDENIVWDEVAEAMAGFLPAFVVEAAGRAFRYALIRTGGELYVEDETGRHETTLTTEDLVNSGLGLRPQLNDMNGASTETVKPLIETAIVDAVRPVIRAEAGRASEIAAVAHAEVIHGYGDAVAEDIESRR